MSNLLEETKEVLKNHSHTLHDIRFISVAERHFDEHFYYVYKNAKVTKEILESILNFNYDDGYGSQEISEGLKLVGDDFWLERHEYDGSEWWEFKELPVFDSKIEVSVEEISIKNNL